MIVPLQKLDLFCWYVQLFQPESCSTSWTVMVNITTHNNDLRKIFYLLTCKAQPHPLVLDANRRLPAVGPACFLQILWPPVHCSFVVQYADDRRNQPRYFRSYFFEINRLELISRKVDIKFVKKEKEKRRQWKGRTTARRCQLISLPIRLIVLCYFPN